MTETEVKAGKLDANNSKASINGKLMRRNYSHDFMDVCLYRINLIRTGDGWGTHVQLLTIQFVTCGDS